MASPDASRKRAHTAAERAAVAAAKATAAAARALPISEKWARERAAEASARLARDAGGWTVCTVTCCF